MTKNNNVYTMPLKVVPDRRAHYSAEDRRAQFELANKLAGLLSTMTTLTERMNLARTSLEGRMSKLPANDAAANTTSARDAVSLRTWVLRMSSSANLGALRLATHVQAWKDSSHNSPT